MTRSSPPRPSTPPPQPCHPRLPGRPPAFPVFVASDLEIHVLLTSSALSPPTRACLCLLSLDLVTVSTQVEFCFLLLGVRVSPSFPFLLLGLRVCVCVCFPKSCFVLRAALAWFHFAGRSLPPSLPPSSPPLPSLPPSLSHSLFWGEGVRGSPGCHWCPSLGPRAPAAGVSVECPPTTLESRGGSASPSGQPPEEIVPSSSPFLCGRGRVASRGSEAEEAPARARAFGRPARWLLGGRRQRPVLGTVEPVVRSHLAAAFILSLPSGASARPSGGL